MIKFRATVTELGPLSKEFIENDVIVFFEEGAPEELREFSILHAGGELVSSVTAGDTLHLGDHPFRVTAVGEVANENLASLGHLVVKFNGRKDPEMPGDVCVEEKTIPSIAPGTEIRIEGEAQD
jgi:PTS system glucitol/sorbitol-specific IIA component